MKNVLCSAAAVAMMTVCAASASTVGVSYQTSGNPFGTENYRQSVTIESPGFDGGVLAGAFQMTGDNGFGDFTAFCVDVYQFLANNTAYETPANLFNMDIVGNLDRLFTSVYASVDSAVEAAAFQVAIWEVIYDDGGPFDLDGGDFSMSNNDAVEDLANDYLAGLGSASTGGYNLTFMYSDTRQDLVTASPVPLPASFLLMLGGLGGIAALRRKAARA